MIPLAKPYHLTGEIRERSFEWYGGKIRGWNLKTGDLSEASMRLTKERPMYLRLRTIWNCLFRKQQVLYSWLTKDIGDGYPAERNVYHLRTIVRVDPGYKGNPYC